MLRRTAQSDTVLCMKRISLELSDELLAQVDEAAGDVPRNRWIRRAIEQQLAADTERTETGITES